MTLEPLIVRPSLIRLLTLLVLKLAVVAAIATFLGLDPAGENLVVLFWTTALALCGIAITFATITLRIDETGLWVNTPISAQHMPWTSIETVTTTGQRPFLSVGLAFTPPSPKRKNGIDQSLGPMWGLPHEELLGILTECVRLAHASAQKKTARK